MLPFYSLVSLAHATATLPSYGSSSISGIVSDQTDTAWDYFQSIVGVVWPYVLGVSIILGVIYLLIRVSRGAR